MNKMDSYRKGFFIAVALAIFLVAGSSIPRYFTFQNMMNVTRQSATIAICAMGMSMVLITKEIDLATGGIMAFCAMVSGIFMLNGYNVLIAILIGLLIGITLGVANGLLVSKIEIPSFIATYVTGQIAIGFALVLGRGRSIGGMPDSYVAVGNNTLFGIPILTIMMLIFLVIISIILGYTRIGKYIYALGGNQITVKQEGVNVDKIKIFALASSGFCAAAAGIFLSSQMNAVHPSQGSTYQLDAVAASVIGGVSMLGGEGKAWMAVVGALIIGFLRNALTLQGIHPYFQNLAVGLSIIVVVGISVFNKNRILDAAKIF